MAQQGTRRVSEAIRSPEFWVAVAMFLVVIPFHYPEELLPFLNIDDPGSLLGLERHPVERVFLLLPITYLGFLIGMGAGLAASGVALAIMLPRALVISEHRPDALVEVAGVIIAGAVINVGFERFRREQERRRQTEEQLGLYEQSYREIFDNAHDAIWIQDMSGQIIMANRACTEITGYAPEELVGTRVRDLMSEEALRKAREVRRKLLAGETLDGPYEQEVIKKDGTRARLWLTTSLITGDGQPRAFQLIARDITEQTCMRENLQFYLQQITRAQEHERERIARELHDDTAQSLLLIAQRLDALAPKIARQLSADLADKLQELRTTVVQTLADLRRLTQDLRPRILDDLGLVPALEWLADDFLRQYGIRARVEVDDTLPEMSEEERLLLFRIAQEALRNAGRHSGATEVTVSLHAGKRGVRMTVADNGRGFELPRALDDLATSGKLGLLGMHERARLLRGTLEIHSGAGKGTTVVVELPADSLSRVPSPSGPSAR